MMQVKNKIGLCTCFSIIQATEGLKILTKSGSSCVASAFTFCLNDIFLCF